MRVKALGSLKSKLLKPCRKLIPLFTLHPKKPVYIRAPRPKSKKATKRRRKSGLFRRLFRSRRKPIEDMDRLVQLKSFSEKGSARGDALVFPSPGLVAPARADRKKLGRRSEADDVEDSCRSFEKYLMEMIVEDGKLRDLTDIEELLHCWSSLTCPVFIGVVSRFYGELCKDLFSAENSPIPTKGFAL